MDDSCPKTKDLNRLEKKIINCFKGAAESTGCKLNIVEGNGTYENLVTDKKLKSIFMENSKTFFRYENQ